MTLTKRKNRNNKNENDESDYFKIEDYTMTDLKSLIDLIYDLLNKNPPPKRLKKKLPIKLYKLIDILEPLEKLNNLIGLTKLKEQCYRS